MRKTRLFLGALLGVLISSAVAAASPNLTISASRHVVVYGQSLTLSGTVPNNQAGQTVTIKVRPLVALKLVSAATGSFNVMVSGDRSFGGKYVLVQRLTSTGPVVMKHVYLDTSSSATFKVRLHHGRSRLRAVIPSSQAAPGYIAGMSNVVLVSR